LDKLDNSKYDGFTVNDELFLGLKMDWKSF
jgi:hypothetical protein